MRAPMWMGLLLVGAACASQPPPPETEPLWKDGVRQAPFTKEEAEELLREASPRYAACYRSESMNIGIDNQLSDYVFQVWVPTDGSGADVEVLEQTQPGQEALRHCLEQALAQIGFPAHVGDPLTLRVPIQGPK